MASPRPERLEEADLLLSEHGAKVDWLKVAQLWEDTQNEHELQTKTSENATTKPKLDQWNPNDPKFARDKRKK